MLLTVKVPLGSADRGQGTDIPFPETVLSECLEYFLKLPVRINM
jgi:hypothetical protein